MSSAFKKRCSQIRQIFDFKYYNRLFKEGNTNHRAHGGVAIFIHEAIACQNLTLKTPLQALEAVINMRRDVTIVFIYNSRSHDMSEKILSTL